MIQFHFLHYFLTILIIAIKKKNYSYVNLCISMYLSMQYVFIQYGTAVLRI